MKKKSLDGTNQSEANPADLNQTDVEAPGGTQATHSARPQRPTGLRERAGPTIRRVRGAADAGASYVRDHDVTEMRSDIENNIRKHPLRSLTIALVGGYLLGKMVD
ncbi:MAG TPA: hypothetical protein VM100_07645 [Longimicrobiales bacterium]|nr:hypothetical protein [Longimicrobiales bacterium]